MPEFKKDERIGSVDFGHEQVDYKTGISRQVTISFVFRYKAIAKLAPLKLD